MACQVLEDLANQWWMAEAMAKLGRRAIKKIRQIEPQGEPAANRTLGASHGNVRGVESRHRSPDLHSGYHSPLSNDTFTGEPISRSSSVARDNRPLATHSAWNAHRPTQNGGANTQGTSVYDMFLLDSIPNLIYPEAGMGDGWFDDIRLFDGFGGECPFDDG